MAGPDGGLSDKKCVPCEGGVPRYTAEQAAEQVAALPGWRLTHDATRIRRDLTFRDFRGAIRFLNNVAALAEREGHHPDLHLERDRLTQGDDERDRCHVLYQSAERAGLSPASAVGKDYASKNSTPDCQPAPVRAAVVRAGA